MAEQRLEEIRKIRIEKAKKLRDLGINPYPSKVDGKPGLISDALEALGKDVEIAGRLMAWREHGNVIFADLKDTTGQIQLWFQKNTLGEKFKILKLLDVGDFLFVNGKVVKTSVGEISVDVSKFQILTKSIRPLPSTWHGLKDVEERYRKRYLDLLLNPGVFDRFKLRTKLVRQIRKYLDDLNFYEVETPTLQPLYGGANAKPFKTYHNALSNDFYLRIADELYLKRLLVGGFDKVYEICKDFRNEGLDQTHSPEFTMIEYYEAYADYQRVMDVTEGLFKSLAKEVLGSSAIEVGDKKINIGGKWPRIEMISAIKKYINLNVNEMSQDELKAYCNKEKIEALGGETKGQLVFTIFEHKVTDFLIEPTWIIDYPKDVSPLSKNHRSKDGWVERFEGYIGGKEICDGWSELTDPIEQRNRFENDVKIARRDKEEAQQVDEDFLEAMEYGMPPIGGIGIGIDRLTMFFSNTWNIKELILFPTLKPERMEVFREKYNYRENKIVAVIDSDLPSGKAMNALGHLAFASGHHSGDEWMGDKLLTDADGGLHQGIAKYPFIVLGASKEQIQKIVHKTQNSKIIVSDYTNLMFETGSDWELVKQTAKTKKEKLIYHAVVLMGKSEDIDKITEGLDLYKKRLNTIDTL